MASSSLCYYISITKTDLKKKTKLITTGLLIIVLLSGLIYALWKYYAPKETSLFLLPNLQSASVIEQSFQNLPEEKHTEGAVKIPIFIYHSVKPYSADQSKIQKAYEITPELLEKQLLYLQNKGYTAISLDELTDDLQNAGVGKAAKPVILTFDDGWHNQYGYAFPLLKKYRMTATFYIYTNPIGKEHFLTWDEIKEMDKAGMTIAGHTFSHPYFKTISLAQIRKELTDSKKIIEEHLGKPVLHFASPYGYTNTDIIAIIKEAGYKTARTTYRGIYHTKDDLLRLSGILVSDNFDDFVKELKG